MHVYNCKISSSLFIAKLKGHTQGFDRHLFVLESKLLSSSYDGTIRIWNLDIYTEEYSL
jgi:hypothetical protein